MSRASKAKESLFPPSSLTDEQLLAINPFLQGRPAEPEKLLDTFAEIIGVTKDAIEAKRKIASNGNGLNGEFHFPDLPQEALDGRLGEICFNRMADFPLAYSWPALLGVASGLIEERSARTNLYCGLVGPVHSGKSQAIEHALKILGLEEPALMDIMSGSAEQLIRKTKDAGGRARLFSPDELGHLFEKMHIENSSFSYILNRAYYNDKFEVLMGKKETAHFDCVLSILGGIVEDKFQKLFDASSTAGLYDRFTFGYIPDGFNYDYKPFSGATERITPRRVVVEHEVWQIKSNWLKLNKEWNPRVVEHAIRAAVVCAAFDGRTCLRAEDLNPAYEMAKYQMLIRDVLKPNPGETFEGKLAHKFLAYLKRYGGKFVGRRELLRMTHAYDLGPSNVDRALSILKSNGDIEIAKSGKQVIIRLVMENEHQVQAGPEEEL